jgi:hypothetical protein
MSRAEAGGMCRKTFHVFLIRPSHYDDDGYVIQWHRSIIPSNTLAVLYGLSRDLAERQVLGKEVEIVITAMDETNTRISISRMIRQISEAEAGGFVAFTGVQTNQFPRTMDMASELRRAGIQVCIGGFHVSGCLAMLPELPKELQNALDIGVSLFAGEAEGRLEGVFIDAYQKRLKPVYNHLAELPELASQPPPFLPARLLQRSAGAVASFDAGRGCPFLCSFCTIINVQGHESRFRSADAIEQIIWENAGQGIWRFLIADDNFARNKDWEEIFDRIIFLREQQGVQVRLLLQVDAMCHRIPGFIEKAGRAGTAGVFIGLESINRDALVSTRKRHNKISEYRKTLQAWQRQKVVTTVGYIAGFAADTAESVAHDIGVIQRELPLDFLQLSYLTPLPGSEDHKKLHDAGVWMDPDLNRYDLNHITTLHPTMSREELECVFNAALDSFYSDEQVGIRLKRARANGISVDRIAITSLWYDACRREGVSGPDGGVFRRKYRRDRRPVLPIESPFVFYPKRVWETINIYARMAVLFLKYRRMCRIIKADPNAVQYSDASLSPVTDNEMN